MTASTDPGWKYPNPNQRRPDNELVVAMRELLRRARGFVPMRASLSKEIDAVLEETRP